MEPTGKEQKQESKSGRSAKGKRPAKDRQPDDDIFARLNKALARASRAQQPELQTRSDERMEMEAWRCLDLLFHLFCSMKGTLMSFISTEELMQEMRHLEDDWSGGVVSPKTKCPIPTDATSSEAMLKAQSHIIRDTFDMMCPLFEHLIKLPIHDTLVRDMSSYVALVSAFSELNTAGPIHQATRSPEGKDRRILPRSQDDMAMLKQSVRRFEKLGGSLDKDSDESDSGDEGWEELMDQCASLKRRRAPNVSYDMIEAPQQTAGISQPTVGASDPTDRASQDTARQARKSTDTAITAFRVRTSYETAFRVPISQETVRQAQPSEDKAQASEDTT